MTYVIEPSTFGIGYSIFRLDIINGKHVKAYLADVPTVAEGKALCVNAIDIFSPEDPQSTTNLSEKAA